MQLHLKSDTDTIEFGDIVDHEVDGKCLVVYLPNADFPVGLVNLSNGELENEYLNLMAVNDQSRLLIKNKDLVITELSVFNKDKKGWNVT